MSTNRRTFLKQGLLYGAALGAAPTLFGCATAPKGGVEKKPEAMAQGETRVRPLSILILGGTGFLGPQLVEAARSRGHKLTLFNRGKTRPELFAHAPEIELLQGDRDGKLEALAGRKWDAVIDTSGYFPRLVKMSAELLAPNVGHYVFISSISVYGDLAKAGIDESAKVATIADPTFEKVTNESYGALKALCEQAAEAAMPGRVTNIRPGLIVGPEDPTDRFTYWPVRIAAGGEVLAPGDGLDPVQFIDARDLAAWTVHAIEEKQFGIFNAVGPAGVLPMKALLEACVQATPEAKATLTWVPAPFLEKEKVTAWGDMPVWMPREANPPDVPLIDCRKAIALGLAFRPVSDTVKDTLAWWRSLPPAAPAGQKEDRFHRTARLRAGIAPEREREVLAAWKAEPHTP